ncbi:hypothetical protein [Pseudanabaena yagii]|uniref:Uncharacterized protein n=1 Tax=Pseudanabaena yagii GIHE-NHR1 TaxID=2722753 RepID=A0ABX1M3F5_9CYAN|nr:hypothetical protein [Pseudanabaena yagii]NMF60612.1 hypothetical protein [Pseudanabaena yagii GIHE-NHR1]
MTAPTPEENSRNLGSATQSRQQLRHERVQKVVKGLGIGAGGSELLGMGWLIFLGQPN